MPAHVAFHPHADVRLGDGPQVRNAYRRKGWAFSDPQQIEQCARESYSKKLREQVGEGCHMWGRLDVKKVRLQLRGRVQGLPDKSEVLCAEGANCQT